MDGNKAVTATFTQGEYPLTVSTVGGGIVAKSPDQSVYTYGAVVTLTATPSAGWVFSGWSGDASGTANPTTVTMNGAKSVTATFTQLQYTLTTSVVGGGSLAKSPDQATYTYGAVVTLTATPSAGWVFSGWSGDLTGTTNPTIITMGGAKTVTATFTRDGYALTVNVKGGGSVSKLPDNSYYVDGTVVTLTATPSPGWVFSGWSGDLTDTTNPSTITMSGDKTVTATFAAIPYTITVGTVGEGSILKSPDQATYSYGNVVTLTATPSPGWAFTGWSGDLASTTNPITITINGNKAVTATFTQLQYTLTTSVVGGGSLAKSPDLATYTYGTVVTLNATPSTGWSFSGWSGSLSSSVNPVTITMDGNKVVTATFTQNQYPLTISTVGGGNVAKLPNQATYSYDTIVTLTATPSAGWAFSGWSGDLSGNTNPATITIDGAKSVTATFTQLQYTVTTNVVGSGSVAKSPNQATYTYGTVVTLTATPSTGWSFSGWSGGASGTTNPVSVTIDGNKAVTATFTQNIYTLTISISGQGVVNRGTPGPYHYGDVVQLNAVAGPGWVFSGWSGGLSGTTNPQTITIDGNKSVTAKFTHVKRR
jgi:uncharacterized repeat protein (TIGR02543 family)